MASEITDRINYSTTDVLRVLNSLGDVVMDKFSDGNNFIEIKLFPGLKVASKYLSPDRSKSNLDLQNTEYVLSLSSTFTDDFRKKIRQLHKKVR